MLECFLEKELAAKKLEGLLKDVEIRLIDVLVEMETFGVSIDRDFLKNLSCNFKEELEELAKNIWNLSGSKFNINSPKQLRYILALELVYRSGLGLRQQIN
mgnify:CR=1 FL=1